MDETLPEELITLGSFEWPRGETRQTLGHLIEKVKTGFSGVTGSNPIAEQDLNSVSQDALQSCASDMLGAHLGELLERSYLDWLTASDAPARCRAFIMPPTNQTLLHDWATRHDFHIFAPKDNVDDLPPNGPVILPNLEQFLTRDHRRVRDMSDLLDHLASRGGNTLIGCNSWAWLYLKQFDNPHLLFEDVKTIPAFNADGLAAILQRALTKEGTAKTLTSIESGDAILTRDSDGALKDPFLQNLAGRSLGHPCVALEMFFRRIAEIDTGDDDEEDAKKDGDHADKIWAGLPKPRSLPSGSGQSPLFALHALLIHGPRPVSALNAQLPCRHANGTWAQLKRAGFIDIENGTARVTRHSYPDIRSELGAAGFNLDKL
jgi:hypothetical protein